jgi:hypothetical protein
LVQPLSGASAYGIYTSNKTTPTPPATQPTRPNDLDSNSVDSSYSRGWLPFTSRTLALSSSCTWQMICFPSQHCTLEIAHTGDQSLRLYLQVECLSDICTADGQRTDPGLQAKTSAVTSQSTIKWPCQGLPGPRSWAIWRRFLTPYHPAMPNPRPVDVPRPPDLACILRFIITNPLSDGVSTSNCIAWYR